MPIRTISLRGDVVSSQELFSPPGQYTVKPPQRRYKWRASQVKQLWGDIVNAYRQGQSSYFLGSLILERLENNTFSIIDGQQRVVSLSLLVAALRDSCEAIGLQDRVTTLQKLIAQVDYDGKPVGPLVLKLQDEDNSIYQDLVRTVGATRSDLTPSNGQKQLLVEAVRTFCGLIDDYLDVSSNKETDLKNLCNYVQDDVKLLPLAVESEAQAHLVFDTTNTRGLPLSPAEALRARLSVSVRDNYQLAQELVEKWNDTGKKLEQAGCPIDAMDQYLLAIWSSKHGHTTLKKLATEVMDKLNKGEENPEALVEEIGSYISHYLGVIRPAGQGTLPENLRDLSKLGVTQAIGFLTMVHRHAPTRFSEAVELTLALYVRNLVMGNSQPHDYQNDWPRWARWTRNGQVVEAFDAIRNAMEDDDVFRHNFSNKEIKNAEIARHLLRRLDPVHQNSSGVILEAVDRDHIMPNSVVTKLTNGVGLPPNIRTWLSDLGYESIPAPLEERKELGKSLEHHLNMLGNQALLQQSWNRKEKDRPFASKKAAFATQGLLLTRELKDCESWGLLEIEKRQSELAEKAVTIWQKNSSS